MSGGAIWVLAGLAALAIALASYLWGRRNAEAVARAEIDLPGTAALIESLRPAFQALPDAALLVDAGGRVVLRNQAAADLTGAIEGRPLAVVFRIPAALQALEYVQAGESPQTFDFTLAVPIERTVDGHAAAFDLGGQPHAMLVLRDTTKITRVDRMRADFVANASHELRTPLASLSGFIETIRGPARDDPEAQARFLEIMQAQAERMRRLIDDLLSLSRIELNEHVRPLGKARLAAIVSDVLDAVQPQLQRSGVKIAFDPGPGEALVLGDREELLQVAQNLLDNAVKYGGDNKTVSITIRASGPMVSCTVEDQGPGIAREHIPRLTERFYRVDAKASRERGGTGLGLAIVKHIVNRHRGRLDVESEPGKGSRFIVSIPAWPQE